MRKFAITTALFATAAISGTALAGMRPQFIDFERVDDTKQQGPFLAEGPLQQPWFVWTGFFSNKGDPVCIKKWPTSSGRLPNALVGARNENNQIVCDPTQPLRIWVKNSNAHFISFLIIGNNPQGWRVTAKTRQGTNLPGNIVSEKHVLQGQPGRMNHPVWIADPQSEIASIYIEPWQGPSTNAPFGLDWVTISQGTSGIEVADDGSE